MSVHVGMKSAKMLSCGSQRAEASSPIQIAAARCHSLAADLVDTKPMRKGIRIPAA